MTANCLLASAESALPLQVEPVPLIETGTLIPMPDFIGTLSASAHPHAQTGPLQTPKNPRNQNDVAHPTTSIRAFQVNLVNIFAAFVAGTLIDGFSTLISESFVQTGRIFDNGVARLRQNNRHQVEIFWPGGLQRYGDGWKLSVRIRFVHAQIRHLLSESPDWDFTAYGTPISAAHMGYALACFSARTLKHSSTLGSVYSREERESFCAVWRYAGHLMGVPDALL